MCGSGVRWCARADAMFDVPGMHVLDVEVDDQQRLALTVESDQLEHGCPGCGGARGRARPPLPSVARRAQPGPGDGAAVAKQSVAVP